MSLNNSNQIPSISWPTMVTPGQLTPCAGYCGRPVHLGQDHYTLGRTTERMVDGELVPIDSDPLAYTHLECWPPEGLVRTTRWTFIPRLVLLTLGIILSVIGLTADNGVLGWLGLWFLTPVLLASVADVIWGDSQ